ncbi:MAG: hypothetical protein E7375_00985 [Clostridiales bacterium]|nr:hypothetical protein [Clostridiales bacterium]
MWELSISVNSKNMHIAKFIYQSLKAQTEDLGAVVTCYEQYDNVNIVFGCPIIEKSRANVVLERLIIKVITNFYKEEFLCDNLHLPIYENMSLTAFKKALINFDKETDFYLISKNLDLEKNLHLDSFYAFRLKALREKWFELVSLANENSEYLVSNDSFFDLLKFLIDNLEICEEEIDVFQDENGYFFNPQSSDVENSGLSKEALVSSLIDLCPKKINLFCKSDDNTAGFLSKIFEERINVCYNKNMEKIDNFSVLK